MPGSGVESIIYQVYTRVCAFYANRTYREARSHGTVSRLRGLLPQSKYYVPNYNIAMGMYWKSKGNRNE